MPSLPAGYDWDSDKDRNIRVYERSISNSADTFATLPEVSIQKNSNRRGMRSNSSTSSSIHSSKSQKFEVTTETHLLKDIPSSEDECYDNAFESCSLSTSPEYATISKKDILQYHDMIVSRSIADARQILKEALKEHQGDPCLPHGKLDIMRDILQRTDPVMCSSQKSMCLMYTLKFEAFLIRDWSIYSEVRSVTRPIDEEGEDYETFRVYFLGILWSCMGAAMDTFFATRYPSISLDAGSILIMLVYSGKLFAKLPVLYIPLLWKGKRFYINSGTPWTFKEQMLATLAMSVSVGSPYSLKAIVSQQNPRFLGINAAYNFGYILMLTASSNFMGLGIAGIMRTFLVYPTRCIWYNVLPTIAVNRALVNGEERSSVNGWRLTGAELFGLTLLLSFLWFWVTNYVFQSLSYFDWPAWIAPRNVHVQAITGCITGLAFNPINTFDWNNIGAVSVMTPLFAQMMTFIGMIVSMLAIIVLWYANISWTSYMPINTTALYTNKGKAYEVRRVLDIPGYKFNEEKYQEYSPPFWSAGSLTNEGAYLMMYTGMVVYSILNYSWEIIRAVKLFSSSFVSSWRYSDRGGSLRSYNDRFSRAQWKYKEVPEWWFLAVMVLSLAVAITMIEHFTFTETPAWTIFFGIGISVVFCVPFGYLYSTTCIHFEINTLFELVIGLAIPGNANALMVSKVYAANFFSQSSSFITNQVQAHYTGIAPRALFRAQIASVTASVLVKAALSYWVISPNGIPDLCDPLNRDKFNCQTQRSFFNQAIQWGTIGPRRIFGGMYPMLKYCFVAGAIYPIPFWLARRYIPRYTSKMDFLLHSFHEMALLAGVSWAPKSLQYVIGVTYVNLLFNWYIKRRFPRWWQKYTYTFGHAMDVGVGYSGLIIFFATEYNRQISISWWGNNKPFEVGDAHGLALKKLPSRGYFGPKQGSFP